MSLYVTLRRSPVCLLAGKVLCSICIGVFWAPCVRAEDPSIAKPNIMIPLHGLMEDAKPIYEQAIKDDEACTKLYAQIKKMGNNAATAGKAVGQLAMLHKRLKRNAERLVDFGESAGAELLARYAVHRAAFEDCFNNYTGLPNVQPVKSKAIALLQKNIQKRKQKASDAAEAAANDPIAAEVILDKGLDEFEEVAGILAPTERGPFAEYNDVEANLRPMAKAARETAVNQEITRQSATVSNEINTYVQDVQKAIATTKMGTLTYADKSMDCLEFADQMFREGFAHQAHLQRVIALQYLVRSPGTYFNGPPPALDPQWNERLHKLRIDIGSAAMKLIEADSQQMPPDKALTRLSQYAKVFGRYAHRTEADEWTKVLDEAIVAAAKKLGAGSKVQSYQKATSDLLAWRERFAAKQEVVLSGKTPTLAAVIAESTKKDLKDPGYIQSLPGGKPSPQFYNATYELLPLMGSKLPKNTPAIVKNVVHMDTDKPVWVSRWDNYIYARLPTSLVKIEPAKALERALLVDETHAPLSVRAASAIHTAEMGEGLVVGATIQEVFVEGAITRLVSLPDIAAPFVGINYPVVFPRDQVPMTASLRASVSPKWYRHRYFVVTAMGN